MNNIWWCVVYLKKPNPRKSSRHAYLYDDLECLVILDENKEYVQLKTNDNRLGHSIRKLVGDKWNIRHVEKIVPKKNHGRSYTKY